VSRERHRPGRLWDAAYRQQQRLASAWARRRHRDEFDRVRSFCLFVGYPRSGHSIVGAILNAHRHAVIAHELNASPLILAGCSRDELYSRILARARWFAMRGNPAHHPLDVPNQWQGRFEELRVIGDKRGGAVARSIAEHPDFLDRLRSLVGVPIRLIHVVRDPFDNIAAISKLRGFSLAESADYYFLHCEATSRLGTLCEAAELITIWHEDMIGEPVAALTELCAFLGLERYPGYIEDAAAVLYTEPSRAGRKVAWPPGLIEDIERRARAHRFLDGYAFESRAASTRIVGPKPGGRQPQT
jgi:sulfotransferase family protein